MGDKWYSYSGFKFTKAQVKWALANIVTLRNGQWPPSHKESGYADEPHSKRVSHEGSFVKAASIAAELDLRIQKCGVDGLLLEFLYSNEPDDEVFVIQHIAYALKQEVREIEKRIQNALYYVSGSDRKTRGYSGYVGHRRAIERGQA